MQQFGRLLVSGCVLLVLAGCSKTTVVLQKDPYGKLGKVVLLDKKLNDKVLNTMAVENQAAAVGSNGESVDVNPSAGLLNKFTALESSQPAAIKRFVIPFDSGSVEVKPEYNSVVDDVRKAVASKKACDNSVIGHSDTVGDDSANKGVSLERAKKVLDVLVQAGLDKNCFDIRYYGEADLAVKTADNVDEPANRRVEIEVR